MAMALHKYVHGLGTAIDDKDGQLFRDMLIQEHNVSMLEALHENPVNITQPFIVRCLGPALLDEGQREWVQFITGHVQSMLAAHRMQWVDAYDYLADVVSDWLEIFRADSIGWTKDPMRQVTLNLENFATFADTAMNRRSENRQKGVLAGKTLQNVFGATCNSKEREKRLVALHVANVFFKVHFKLNMLQMCKHLMKTFQNTSFNLDEFPLADRVTFSYYAGKLALVEQEYRDARDHLEYAYKWCMRVAEGNVRKILKCLVPLRMLGGVPPTRALLEKYRLGVYVELADAVQNSNIGKFEQAVKANRSAFVKMDTSLLVERLKFVSYRQILRVVVRVHNEMVSKERRNKVPMVNFVVAMKLKGAIISMNDALCIMASMISQNYLKGYVSFSHKQLVLAPDPFPGFDEIQHAVMEL